MSCCNHNCNQGRDCPNRTDDGFSEWLDSVGRFVTVFAAACILGWLLGWAAATLAVRLLP